MPGLPPDPPLADPEELASYLGLPPEADRTPLGFWLEVASAVVRAVCGRRFVEDVATTERHPVRGDAILRLAEVPVATVEDVRFGPPTAPTEDMASLDQGRFLLLDPDAGRLYVSPPGAGVVAVMYTGGASPPPDVRAATVQIAAWGMNSSPQIAGDLQRTAASGAFSQDFLRRLPPEAYELLRPHRRRPAARVWI